MKVVSRVPGVRDFVDWLDSRIRATVGTTNGLVCGRCASMNIHHVEQEPYGKGGGQFIADICGDCGASRVVHDDWANWK